MNGTLDTAATTGTAPVAAPRAVASMQGPVLVAVAVFLLGLAATWGLVTGEWRRVVALGVVCSGVGGAAGLWMVGRVRGGHVNALLAAKSQTFGIRAVLVAIGLVVTTRVWHGDPIAFVVGFFPLFMVFSVLEQWVALSRPKPPAASGGESN
jgi:hypothetical protein